MSYWRAYIVTAWQRADDDSIEPVLGEMLQSGDSIMDVTGQVPENIIPDPNASTWELWDHNDGTTLDAVEGDNRFTVVWSEEVPDADA